MVYNIVWIGLNNNWVVVSSNMVSVRLIVGFVKLIRVWCVVVMN